LTKTFQRIPFIGLLRLIIDISTIFSAASSLVTVTETRLPFGGFYIGHLFVLKIGIRSAVEIDQEQVKKKRGWYIN